MSTVVLTMHMCGHAHIETIADIGNQKCRFLFKKAVANSMPVLVRIHRGSRSRTCLPPTRTYNIRLGSPTP